MGRGVRRWGVGAGEMCCNLQCCLRCFTLCLVVGALLYLGINSWMGQKSYVFDADEIADITKQALKSSKGKGS